MTSDPRPEPDGALGPEPPSWDAFDEPDPPGRARRLLVLAAIPWLVVAVLTVRTFSGPGTSTAAPGTPVGPTPTDAEAGPDAAADATPTPAPSGTPGPGPVALRYGARAAPGPADAASVATIVARTWLGAIGPEPELDVGAADGPPVYVDHLAVEAVDIPTPDAAVVTVMAVVLEAHEGSYTSARIVRIGVPIALDGTGAHPAGEPWWLATPDLAPRPVTWTPVDDPDALASAGAALETAGYGEVSVLELATSPTWPLRATVTAVAPGTDAAGEHVVWLRDHLGDLVVAGVLPTHEEVRP